MMRDEGGYGESREGRRVEGTNHHNFQSIDQSINQSIMTKSLTFKRISRRKTQIALNRVFLDADIFTFTFDSKGLRERPKKPRRGREEWEGIGKEKRRRHLVFSFYLSIFKNEKKKKVKLNPFGSRN